MLRMCNGQLHYSNCSKCRLQFTKDPIWPEFETQMSQPFIPKCSQICLKLFKCPWTFECIQRDLCLPPWKQQECCGWLAQSSLSSDHGCLRVFSTEASSCPPNICSQAYSQTLWLEMWIPGRVGKGGWKTERNPLFCIRADKTERVKVGPH